MDDSKCKTLKKLTGSFTETLIFKKSIQNSS